ncbi:MAG: hypothetical protein QM757_25765 [Paludibaculum sp.]
MLQLSPPDKYGYMSFGTGVDCSLTAARHARRVIAEVNPNMPRTLGQTFIHVSEVDRIVEVDHPAGLHMEPADDIQLRIADNVASLIPNGATTSSVGYRSRAGCRPQPSGGPPQPRDAHGDVLRRRHSAVRAAS